MARYRVLKRSFINSALRGVGDVIEFDGEAGSNLLRLDSQDTEAKPVKAATSAK